MSSLIVERGHTLGHRIRIASWFRALVRIQPFWYWAINFCAVAIIIGWLLLDARFEASVQWWRYDEAAQTDAQHIRDMGDWWWLGLRNRTVILIGSVATISCILMTIGLGFGPRAGRSVRAWLIATSIFALWLTLFMNWRDVAWLGKQYRLRAVIGEFEEAVRELKSDWPTGDGERRILGPFMAYPTYQPATLILLKLPQFKNSRTSFSVVEGGQQAIRLELVGAEQGDWLEWHPSDSMPRDFVSGLGETYQVARYQRLDGNWFLVRY